MPKNTSQIFPYTADLVKFGDKADWMFFVGQDVGGDIKNMLPHLHECNKSGQRITGVKHFNLVLKRL